VFEVQCLKKIVLQLYYLENVNEIHARIGGGMKFCICAVRSHKLFYHFPHCDRPS